MKKRSRNRVARKSGKKTMLFSVGVIVLLVVLFFLSFWITGLVLKAGQGISVPGQPGIESAKPTPKPTYEELEKLLEEKNEEIERLTRELEQYRDGDGSDKPLSTTSSTPKPAEKTDEPKKTATPAPTKKPSASPTVKPSAGPSVQPTAKPTAKPTATPTPVPTAKPSKAPVVIGPPNAGVTE